MTDYYRILGINSSATDDEIKTAYRKLSKKFHPDLNQGDEFFEARFKEIQEAYEKLSNKSFREEYDNSSTKQSNTNQFSTSPNDKYYSSSQTSNPFEKPVKPKSNNKLIRNISIPIILILAIALVKEVVQKSIRDNAVNNSMNSYLSKNSPKNSDYSSPLNTDTISIETQPLTFDTVSQYDKLINPSNINSKVDKQLPSIPETEKWLLQKLNNYVVVNVRYSNPGPIIDEYRDIISSFSIENSNLIVYSKTQIYKPYVSEQGLKNASNAGIPEEFMYMNSKERRLHSETSYRIEIPFSKIWYNVYDKDKNYDGQCEFSISTDKRDILERNISKNTISYTSGFSFKYDCSKEENLGDRINSALEYLKKSSSKKTTKKDEPF